MKKQTALLCLTAVCLACPGVHGQEKGEPSSATDLPPGDPGSPKHSGAAGREITVPYAPVFKTSFESAETFAKPADAHAWIALQNLATGSGAFESPVGCGIYYESGTASDRYARVIDDPTRPGNSVLHYWLKNAAIPTNYRNHTKGRIQSSFEIGTTAPVTELYSKQRIYLHPDLGLLLKYPPNGDPWWLGISIHELWMGAAWQGHPNSALITLALVPDVAAGAFRLAATCNTVTTFEVFWEHYAGDSVLPLGEWLTFEVGYRMGNAETGRFVVKVQSDNATKPTVIDVTNWTYSPHADKPGGTGPVAPTHWKPQKLYASDNVIHFIRDSGGVAQILWDDFEFSYAWPPGWPPPDNR